MLTTLIAGEPNVMLIDEPEAFLHPTLLARLGKEITTALTGTNRRLFAATHSASFLMGCVQGGAPINFTQLAEYGIFVVPTGEIESRLQSLSINRGKNTWLSTIFEAMGEDTSSTTYVSPNQGDVWSFIGDIATWVRNPKRKGIPD